MGPRQASSGCPANPRNQGSFTRGRQGRRHATLRPMARTPNPRPVGHLYSGCTRKLFCRKGFGWNVCDFQCKFTQIAPFERTVASPARGLVSRSGWSTWRSRASRSQRIVEHRGGFSKGYAMLRDIRLCFAESHSNRMAEDMHDSAASRDDCLCCSGQQADPRDRKRF